MTKQWKSIQFLYLWVLSEKIIYIFLPTDLNIQNTTSGQHNKFVFVLFSLVWYKHVGHLYQSILIKDMSWVLCMYCVHYSWFHTRYWLCCRSSFPIKDVPVWVNQVGNDISTHIYRKVLSYVLLKLKLTVMFKRLTRKDAKWQRDCIIWRHCQVAIKQTEVKVVYEKYFILLLQWLHSWNNND